MSDAPPGPRPVAHFLHVGKTGGSAVKAALAPHAREGAYDLVLVHPHSATLADVPEGEAFFFFLRDPVSRFMSGFYSRQRQGRPHYDVPWSPEEQAAFQRFTTAGELADALCAAEGSARLDAARAAMRGIQHVADPQWAPFGDEATLRARAGDLLLAGRQERLAGDVARLVVLLGLPGASLPDDEVTAHRNPPGVDRTLSPAALEALRAWYADDARLLALCEELSPAP